MDAFSPDVIEGVANQREFGLTTYGRKTGKARRVTIWAVTDGRRVYIRSGQGLRRHWPQNLLARGKGVLHLGRAKVEVRPRLLSDPAEARAISDLYRRKYGATVKPSAPDEPLTLGEQASFELLPSGDPT